MYQAIVGDIARHRVKDGPGIRTTVFFKGCPLHCPWCHNPELIVATPEIAFYPQRCLGCEECVKICPQGAVTPGKPPHLDRQLCDVCGQCVANCPSKALELVGKAYEVEELVEVLLRDRPYYETSGGGVTLSGGEATMQMPVLERLLKRLKEEGIHTALQTCGYFNGEKFFTSLLDLLDLIQFDLKIADPARHEQILGKSNRIIVKNLKRLARTWPGDLVVRIPLVPGFTAEKANIRALASLLQVAGVGRVSFLPYHPWGLSKANKVGRQLNSSLPDTAMSHREAVEWRQFFKWAEIVE